MLNAEWNQPEERKVYLHRHPAFVCAPRPICLEIHVANKVAQFGRFEDVAADCCGYCPVPVTEEEKEIAEEESKIYVSGKISFIKDDPGRQVIRLITEHTLPPCVDKVLTLTTANRFFQPPDR